MVGNIMNKIDIIGCFIKAMYRVVEKITSRAPYSPSYYAFVSTPELSGLLVRVFGFGV